MNDLALNKITSIIRCVKRAREEYHKAKNDFENNFSQQDAAILNILRACEQAIDLANHLIKVEKLGLPNNSADAFDILAKNKIITADLAYRLIKMVGFRNICMHEYQALDFTVLVKVITQGLEDLLKFSEAIQQRLTTQQ